MAARSGYHEAVAASPYATGEAVGMRAPDTYFSLDNLKKAMALPRDAREATDAQTVPQQRPGLQALSEFGLRRPEEDHRQRSAPPLDSTTAVATLRGDVDDFDCVQLIQPVQRKSAVPKPRVGQQTLEEAPRVSERVPDQGGSSLERMERPQRVEQPHAASRRVEGETLLDRLEQSQRFEQPSAADRSRAEGAARNRKSNPVLIVQVVKVGHITDCEYRMGDLTMSLIGGKRAFNVYAQVTMSQVTRETGCVTVTENDTADLSFASNAEMSFAYRGERSALVSVRDKRGVQGVLRGDPLVGEAHLALDGPAMPVVGVPKTAQLALARGRGASSGVLTIRYWFSEQ